jgi:hypothetical protein
MAPALMTAAKVRERVTLKPSRTKKVGIQAVKL